MDIRYVNKRLSIQDQSEDALKMHQRTRVQTMNLEPSMAQQQFKDECDINNIMRKHGADPVAFQALTRKGGIYADLTQITDYQSMLHKVMDADNAFQSLPAQLRQRFSNDPGQLLTFLQDSSNYSEAVSLGLLEPKPHQTETNQSNKPTKTKHSSTPPSDPIANS